LPSGYLVDSSNWIAVLEFHQGSPRPTSFLYGTGSTASACPTRRWKSLPRDRDVRRLKRNVNSSRSTRLPGSAGEQAGRPCSSGGYLARTRARSATAASKRASADDRPRQRLWSPWLARSARRALAAFASGASRTPQAPILEDRPGGHRGLVLAVGAHEQAAGCCPRRRATAARAHEPLRPPQLHQVVPAPPAPNRIEIPRRPAYPKTHPRPDPKMPGLLESTK
jgi:hypothetical protein